MLNGSHEPDLRDAPTRNGREIKHPDLPSDETDVLVHTPHTGCERERAVRLFGTRAPGRLNTFKHPAFPASQAGDYRYNRRLDYRGTVHEHHAITAILSHRGKSCARRNCNRTDRVSFLCERSTLSRCKQRGWSHRVRVEVNCMWSICCWRWRTI